MTGDPRPSLCLVEDDAIMGESLCDRFELEGFEFDWHKNAASAMRSIGAKNYSVVISDVRLPDLSGEELFTQLLQQDQSLPPFIFITGFGSIDRAVHLLKLGAADYITKPFDLEQLIEKISELCGRTGAAPRGGLGPVLGISPAMRKIGETLPRLAKHATTVLITGESGVGKERVAQQLDRLTRDSEKCPFVAVNCGALPESLMEAELFGYEKGAFTGAIRTRKGVFEQAHCGTLFLDEIGEMPPSMQVKLLRAIQDRRITRVGGETSLPVDLRLICATNRDLKELVEKGLFREDLYYRINVIHLRIPPLRERKEDILWFARLFLDEFAELHAGERRTLHPSAEQALLEYPWPGNIRELRHCIERAYILSNAEVLGPDAFFGEGLIEKSSQVAEPGNLNEYLGACERRYIVQALEQSQWQMAKTALVLGISRKNLWEKMKKLGIQGKSSDVKASQSQN